MAVSDEVGVYNLALNAVGERSNLSSPTENSRQAEVCRLWYETVRNHILSAAPWPEAMAFDYLALLDEQDNNTWTAGEPRPGYRYVYAEPSDCLRPRYLSTFEPFMRTEGRIHTNTQSAILFYTKKQANVSLWSSDLLMAIAYGLAAHICNPLSGKPSRARVLADQANELILGARVNAANSQTEQHESIPEWIRARGYTIPERQRFIYPMGNLLQVSV